MSTALTSDGRVITETYTEHELYSMYDEMLDECHPDVKVCGMTYTTSGILSDILKRVDPIAYRCGFVDWLDAEGYEEHPTEDDTYYLDSECEEVEESDDDDRLSMHNESPYGE